MQAVIRLYREARRRKVFRTAALYVVGAWLALQVAALMFPGFGIPDSAIRALIWAAALGLPVAAMFGWLFEIGSGGIRRTAPAAAGEAALPQPLARRDYLILAAFAAIAAVLIYRTVAEVRETPKDVAADAAAMADPESVERLPSSIAVLPFANISEDPANEYFCDGIAEEILTQLGAIRGLNVIGRTSSFAFKGSDYGIGRISSLLGVRYVLQGSVRKAGDQLRVSAQLLDAEGVQVWGESFDRQLRNIFEIQSEIAAAVAGNVASQVLPEAEGGRQPDIVAYDHYLHGRDLLHSRNADLALKELRRAVEVDPEFAEAHAELAIAEAFYGTPEALDRARRSIGRALELKPRLLRARAAQGFLLTAGEQPDPAGAERVLRDVLAQDPNMSDALLWLQNSLHMQGRDDEARPILERAAKIDPLHPSIAANLAELLIEEGRRDEAMRVLRRALEQPFPGPMIAHVADIYRSTGDLAELVAVQKNQTLRRPVFSSLFFLVNACAVLGDWQMADAVNERLLQVPPEGPGRVYRRMILPGLKGQTDATLQRLREAYAEHGLSLVNLGPFDRVAAGTHLARGRDYATAIEVLEPVVDIDSPYSSVVANSAYSPAAHWLAWSYLKTGADTKAVELLAALSRECSGDQGEGRLRDSWNLHRCAEVELLRGNVDPALSGLERAIEAGWREYYVRERDPIWASIADNTRYRALMAKVKADVDRQRAEVERIDPRDRFLAKLDAALAASAATGQ